MKELKNKELNIPRFRKLLRVWYRENTRDLPWRRTKDPYKILVSEVMLHQTRVDTVTSYYQRWMEKFDTVHKLAEADLDEVLLLWSGLGYYNRARNLHKAARKMVEDHGGQTPRCFQALLKLPGIGKYTAAAVASFAYHQWYPTIDTNVRRVITRIFALDPSSPGLEKHCWDLGLKLMGKAPPAEFNQSVMELGALVCKAEKPLCGTCPISYYCKFPWKGKKEKFSGKQPPRKVEKFQAVLAILIRKKKIYIQKRPPHGLFGGLWEFPGGKILEKETPEQALTRELQEQLGTRVKIVERRKMFRYSYTRFRVALFPFICQPAEKVFGEPAVKEFQWVKLEDLEKFAFPAANWKIIKELVKEVDSRDEAMAFV